MDNCDVCCEKYNKTVHKKVNCPFCDLCVCKTCCQKYLISSIEDTHCMKCKNLWNREFVDTFCTKYFRNTDYRKHRELVLFDREKIRMPETQPEVERILHMRRLDSKIGTLRGRIMSLHTQYTLDGITIQERGTLTELIDLNTEIKEAFRELLDLRKRVRVVTTEQKLTRKCPLDECKGFIDEDWYCGLCQNTFCEQCNELVGEGHTCNPDSVKTMKLLKRDTKSCPKCGTMIHKIDGCAQMWCIECHTAFSWETGRIETGRIHNPHYMEFKNKNMTSREHGDIPCGGVPDFEDLKDNPFMTHIRRIIAQYNRDIYYQYDEIYDTDNVWLRVYYMLNDMSKEEFKRELQRRDKLREKNRDIRNIYQMFVDTAGDLLRQYVLDVTEYVGIREILMELVEYINVEVRNIHTRYTCIVPRKLEVFF